MAAKNGKKVEAILSEHDDEVRAENDSKVLKDAEELSNSASPDPKQLGRVMRYVVQELQSQGKIVRAIAETMPEIQYKADCAINHATPMGKLGFLGYTLRLPVVVLMVLFFLWQIYQDQMNRIYPAPAPIHFNVGNAK